MTLVHSHDVLIVDEIRVVLQIHLIAKYISLVTGPGAGDTKSRDTYNHRKKANKLHSRAGWHAHVQLHVQLHVT